MASIQDIYYQKVLKQKQQIMRILEQSTSASIELPNHEVLYPLNIEWLKENGIETKVVTDRDGRPITLMDTSKVLVLDQALVARYAKKPLFEDQNVR